MDLVEGQTDYDFFRSAADGTSATTVNNANSSETVIGMSDILEAKLRSGIATTSQSDSSLTKVDRSTYGGYANKRSCLLYTSPSPRDGLLSRMPSSA